RSAPSSLASSFTVCPSGRDFRPSARPARRARRRHRFRRARRASRPAPARSGGRARSWPAPIPPRSAPARRLRPAPPAPPPPPPPPRGAARRGRQLARAISDIPPRPLPRQLGPPPLGLGAGPGGGLGAPTRNIREDEPGRPRQLVEASHRLQRLAEARLLA